MARPVSEAWCLRGVGSGTAPKVIDPDCVFRATDGLIVPQEARSLSNNRRCFYGGYDGSTCDLKLLRIDVCSLMLALVLFAGLA